MIGHKKKRRDGQTQNIGGPPVKTYRDMDDDFEYDGLDSYGPDLDGLPKPFSCMVDLISDSTCGKKIPEDKRKKASKAFSEVTGYAPADYETIFQSVSAQNQAAVDFISGYIYTPVMLLSIVIIWLGVGFGWFNWVVGIFLTLLAYVILYGFSIAYRLHAKAWLREQNENNMQYLEKVQNSFDDSIAYWPQGLFAVACALECDGDSWKCNDKCGKKKPCKKACAQTPDYSDSSSESDYEDSSFD